MQTTNIEFREISLKNLDEIIELEVQQAQKNLVADNLYSIAQASLDQTGWCRGVYVGEKPVGFFYLRKRQEGALVYICRFMIDRQHQGRGIGRKVMTQLLNELFSTPRLEIVDLAVSNDEGGAQEFYKKCGFTPTNETYMGGWRMVMLRSQR